MKNSVFKLSKWPVAMAAALLSSACTMMPAYQRPASPVPAAWPEGAAYASGAESAQAATVSQPDWQSFFTDPQLRQLIALSLQNNRDLRVAALNVQALQAQYRIQRADLLPAVDASGSQSVQRTPESLRVPGESAVSRQYGASIGVTSWEIDLFGRIRSLDAQALQTYFAQEQTRRSTQISLVAEVANAYLSLRADQALLRLTEQTLSSRVDSLQLNQLRFDHGRASELDVSQAQSLLETARADLARYTRLVAQDRNALQLLIGTALPDDIAAGGQAQNQPMLEDLPANLPSDLLVRRPDVLAAEHSLQASNANIGAARAAFFPRITLTGSYGTASTELSGLFDGGSSSWSFLPQISVPIFAGGANRANLDLAKLRKDIAVANYEKSIQTAFREVADALAARGTLSQQTEAQRAVVAATQRSAELSRMRFKGGIADYLSVLDSERSLYAAQQTLIGDELSGQQNLVSLYKAMGGGWY